MRDLKFHFSLPVCWSIAYRCPLMLRDVDDAVGTAGDVTIAPAALNVHSTAGALTGPAEAYTPVRAALP